MNQDHSETYESLNAFIDEQLATDERMQIIDALKKDDDLSLALCELRRNDELLALTFNNAAKPRSNIYTSATQKRKKKRLSLAASVLFFFSAIVGWQFNNFYFAQEDIVIQDLSQLGVIANDNDKILIHVSMMDAKSIEAALNKAESILQSSNKNLKLEIVANADGLGLLRENSPYKSKISLLSQNHSNVSFKACGIAMNVAKLKEGKEIKLLPEAEKIPAALDQILNRLKSGWAYFKA